MKDTKRALRRHHRRRIIVRTLKIVKDWGLAEEDRLPRALRVFNNRQWCTCVFCRNRRKLEGPTVQERRISYRDDWETLETEL